MGKRCDKSRGHCEPPKNDKSYWLSGGQQPSLIHTLAHLQMGKLRPGRPNFREGGWWEVGSSPGAWVLLWKVQSSAPLWRVPCLRVCIHVFTSSWDPEWSGCLWTQFLHLQNRAPDVGVSGSLRGGPWVYPYLQWSLLSLCFSPFVSLSLSVSDPPPGLKPTPPPGLAWALLPVKTALCRVTGSPSPLCQAWNTASLF